MDKLFLDKEGRVLEFQGKDRRTEVRFPVCLRVEHDDYTNEACADFILNIGRHGVYIMTKNPYEKGTKLRLRFCIPPEDKVLSVVEGVVVGINNDNPLFPRGMHVKLTGCDDEDLKRLEEFFEGKRHIVDEMA